jgi:hypothetical protein
VFNDSGSGRFLTSHARVVARVAPMGSATETICSGASIGLGVAIATALKITTGLFAAIAWLIALHITLVGIGNSFLVKSCQRRNDFGLILHQICNRGLGRNCNGGLGRNIVRRETNHAQQNGKGGKKENSNF